MSFALDLPMSGDSVCNHSIRITAEQADRVLRAEYFQSIQSLAQSLKEDIEGGEYEDWDHFTDAVHWHVDGSEWVIYTSNNLQVLQYSDNRDAWEDVYGMGSEHLATTPSWAQMAYCAMEADLWEQLDAIGVNADLFDEIEVSE